MARGLYSSPANQELNDIVFKDDTYGLITLKRFFDNKRLYKVLVTADERITKVYDGLRNKVEQELKKRHPGYLGVAIVYQ